MSVHLVALVLDRDTTCYLFGYHLSFAMFSASFLNGSPPPSGFVLPSKKV